MKMFVALAVAVLFLALSIFAVPVYADDSVFDKIGDWWAVRGKDDPEKSIILAQRKTERVAKQVEKDLDKSAKEMNKSLKKAFGN